MQPKLRLLMVTLSVILFSFVTNFSFAQTASTLVSDYEDYPPGAIVTLTGSGFGVSEVVKLQVVHVGNDPDGIDPDHHQVWEVTTDADGNFVATWNVPVDGDAAGASLKATADGQTSGLHAEAFFTDASANGDFRSKATGDWNLLSTWEMFNGTSWVNATAYPGQGTGTGNVLIQNNHTVTLNINPAQPIGSLNIGVSGAGVASLTFDNASRTLTVTGSVVVEDGSIAVNDPGAPARTHTLLIGGDLSVLTGSTFNM